MSYILDALRRVRVPNRRGAVPGVHAQPVPLGSAQAKAAPPSRLWVGVSLTLAAVLVVMLAWQWMGHDAAPEAAEAARAAPPLPITPTPPPPVAEAPPAALPAPAVPAAPVQVAPAAPAAQAVAAVRKPVPAAKPAAPAAPRAVAAAASALNGSAAALAASRLPTASELPDDIQRGLPTLVVGGASYSQNAESRMLIVNGQVLREGDKVAPEVTLEEIRLKEAVLSAKGHRYRIAY
jgi:general secretion pathway protein B